MLRNILLSSFLFFLFCVPVFAKNVFDLSRYNKIERVSDIFQDRMVTGELRNLLGNDYEHFIINFDAIAEPRSLPDGGLFVEGWMEHLRLENASVLVIYPDGKLYVAWVVPGNDKIEYRTTDNQLKDIQSDIIEWSKRFDHLTFTEKKYPPGFIDKEPKIRHLETARFNVKVTLQCAVKDKVCNQVIYEGTRKSDGATLALTGKVIRSSCDDVVCPINSYKFKNKNTTYILENVSPSLVVIVNNKMVLNEKGVWSDN